MGFVSIIGFAHQLVSERVRPGDTAIDATAGNGNDTLLLAQWVGDGGVVYSFDIQAEALNHTRERLSAGLPEALGRVRLIERSHAELLEAIPSELHGSVAAVMFNLGYLPGGDHAVVTRPDSTLPALEAALALLRAGGIVTAIVYSGHPGGLDEAHAVERWAAALPQQEYRVLKYQFANQRNHPPYLIAVEKQQVKSAQK